MQKSTVFSILISLVCGLFFPILSVGQTISNEQPNASIAESLPITTHPEADLMPALSPNGKWIAYVSRANKNYDIWVKSANGGLATPLTTHTSDDYSPAWAPDGKHLAFISRRDDAEGDLYWLELKFGEETIRPGKTKLLGHNLARENFPAFSRDGKKVAFSLGAPGQEQIWLYEIKTRQRYPLTKFGGTQPAWAPDGKQIALSCSTPGVSGQQIFLISADTTKAERVQITFEGDNSFPTWSPDGKKILVQRLMFDREKSATPRRSHLRLISVERLEAPRELQITPVSENARFPFWGSDRAIYYGAERYGNLDIWRIPESGLLPPYHSPREGFLAAQALSDPEMALLTFSSLPYYFPDSTQWLSRAAVESGRRHLALGDTTMAKNIFQRVNRDFAQHEEAAAFAEIELAQLTRRLDLFTEISARHSSRPVVQAFCALETGKALQADSQLEAALRYFQVIPSKYPTVHEACYEALWRAGDIQFNLRRTELAEAAYLKIITDYPAQENWRVNAVAKLLDGILRQAASADTSAIYQRLMQRYAATPAVAYTARWRIAQRLFREKEIKLAENEYQQLAALLAGQGESYLQTLRAETLWHLMRLYIHENDFPAAVQQYTNLRADYSSPVEKRAVREARHELTAALIQRARLLVRAQDFELARTLYQQARLYNPQNLEAQRGYIETMQALGDIDDVINEYEKTNSLTATATPVENEITLYGLGLAYSYKGENKLGLLKRSSALIERALRINFRLIPAYLTLGFNYEGLERLEQIERERKKGFFEKAALALPETLDKLRRLLTFRPPQTPVRWYEKAIEVLTIAIALNDEKTDPAMEANLALNLANNYYNLGEYGFEYALHYFRRKLAFDSTFVSARQKALIFERIGECAWATRRYDEAIPYLKTSAQLCRDLRDVDGELRNLNRVALVYQSMGDYNTSSENFAKVDTVSRRENRAEGLPLIWRNIAYNYQQNKETDEAIAKSEYSAALLERADKAAFPTAKNGKLTIKLLDLLPIFWMTIDPFGDSHTEGLSYDQEKALLYSIRGESFLAEKNFANAIALFGKKAETFRQAKNGEGEARALNNLGNLWYSYQEFETAYNYFAQSVKLCDRLQLPAGKVVNLINMGNIAALQKNDARVQRIDSLLQASTADIEQIALQSPRQKLAVLNTLGNLYLNVAQRLFAKNGASAPQGHGVTKNDLAGQVERTYHALQNLRRAQAAYDTALAISRTNHLAADEVTIRRNLASLFVLSGDHALALAQLQAAHEISVSRNLIDRTWRIEHAIGALAQTVRLPATHPLAKKSALAWYLGAIQLLEGLPEEPEGSEQRLAEAEEQIALYENAVALLAAQNQPRAALELAERARGNRFVNLISTRFILPKKQRHRLIWGGGGGDALFVQRNVSRWRGEVAKLEAEELPRPKELARVRAELAAAEREYQNVVQAALVEDPELASFFSTQPFDTQALQDSLDNETAILEYFVAENELVVWLLSHARLEQTRVPISRQRLRDRVTKLRNAWQNRREDHAGLSRELSALLLKSVRGLEEFRRIVIVPDDCLHYLPFAALEYDGESFADLFMYTTSPGLSALNFATRHQNLNETPLVVLQDFKPAPGDTIALRLAASGINLQTWRGVDWYSDTGRKKIQPVGLLHIQNRFTVQPQRPLDSGFQLGLADNAASPVKLVPLSRLFELDLTASLVVLDNTNILYAPDRTGDEMIALQRSFISAGTPTLLYSQWQVEPPVREIFFNAFYKNLATQPAIIALSLAQQAVREKFPHPHDWAGFQIAGFPGMAASEKKVFANRYFEETVKKGNASQENNEFVDAVRYYQTALTMAGQLDQPEAINNLHLLIKSSAISGNDYATACEVEAKILEKALAANDMRQITRSYRNLSTWQTQLKNYSAAIETEQKYLTLAEGAKNSLAIADSRLQLARIHEAAGQYGAAMAEAEPATEILRQQNQALPRFNAETFLGKLALEDDQYGAALDYLEKATSAFLQTRQPANAAEQRSLATAYELTGVVYSRLTAYGQALTFHQKALELFETLADTANRLRSMQYLANAYWLNGDFQNALLQQRRVLHAARAPREKLLGQSTLGLILLSLGNFDAALEAEIQALQMALETDDRREQATIHKNIGLVYLQKAQYQQALLRFKQAAALDRQLGYDYGQLYDFLFLGQTFQILTLPDSAQIYLAKAEVLARQLNDRRVLSKTLYSQGLVALDRGNKTAARAILTEALAKAAEFKLEEMQWRCLWKLGLLAHQAGELPAALDFYTRALAALERQSAKIKVEEYRSGFIDNKSEIYEEAVLLLLQMNRPAEALTIAERAKSRSFADLLANHKIDFGSGADRGLLARRDRLADLMSFVQGKIFALQQKTETAESHRFTIAALNDTLNALQKDYANTLAELKAANPALADMVSVEPLPMAQVQAMLADSVALVEYFFAKDRLISWVVDRQQARAVQMPLERQRLNESITQFRRALTKRASTEIFSRELYDLLIKPNEPLLMNAKQLVIVPHGILHYLPFPALQKADSTYLIDRFALALAPSATVLGFCYRQGTARLQPTREDWHVLTLGNPAVGNPLFDLPFAEKEIKSISQTFGEIESYTRQQATAQALINSASRADLLHLSCHGVYDERNPLFSALLLAPDSSNVNGRLEAHEIFSLQLNASLVMLSACETGLARVTGGDEVIGLARGFIFAGAPSLIASLWTVDDLATAITVKRFYRYLKSGMSKAEALRDAQRFVRDHHNRHPAYWASFGLTGDWR